MVFKKQAVHFPEPALRPGELSRFASRLGQGVQLAKGEISKDKAQTVSELVLYCFYDRVGVAAVWTMCQN